MRRRQDDTEENWNETKITDPEPQQMQRPHGWEKKNKDTDTITAERQRKQLRNGRRQEKTTRQSTQHWQQ